MTPPEVRVYDWQGNERDLEYLHLRYGPFVIYGPPEGDGLYWRVSALYERADGPMLAHAPMAAASLVVMTCDEAGARIGDVPVCLHWRDAPVNGDAPPYGGSPAGTQFDMWRAVIGRTNVNGDVGFGLGGGSYYDPKTTMGPHAMWIAGVSGVRSEVFQGAGMITLTNHYHLDVAFSLCGQDDSDPPGPVDPPPIEGYQILDYDGNPWTREELVRFYGDYAVHQPLVGDGDLVYQVVTVQARQGPPWSMAVTVLDENGLAKANVPVSVGRLDRTGEDREATTDWKGTALFYLGQEEKYPVTGPESKGPLGVAIHDGVFDSEVSEGHGRVMVAKRFLDVTFQLKPYDAVEPPTPPAWDKEPVLTALGRIVLEAQVIEDAVDTLRDQVNAIDEELRNV